MGLLSYVRSIDLFGQRVQLRFHKKKDFKTTIGGSFTILLFVATILVAWIQIQEMVLRKNPQLQYKEELWTTNKNYKVSDQLFKQIIGIYDLNTDQYTQNAKITLYINTTLGRKYIYSLVQCISDNQIFSEILIENVGRYYCLTEQDFSQIQLYLIDYTSQIEIQVQIDNSSVDERYEMRVIQQDHFLDATDYEQPFKTISKLIYVQLSQEQPNISIRVTFQLVQVQSDEGYIESKKSTNVKLIVSDTDIFQLHKNNSTQNQFSAILSFNLDRKIQTHMRSYTTLLNVISIIGGFIKSMIVAFTFITKPFTKMSLNVSLLNDLFSFNDQNKDGQTDKKNVSSISVCKREQDENRQLNQILNQEIYNERKGIHENKQQQSEAEQIFRKFMRIDQKTLTMGFLDYFKCLVADCCKHRKGQIIKTSKKKVNERLDIVYILKKLVEIDKLKILLLNDQQRRVFDYLPKPLVTYNNSRGAKNSITYLKQNQHNSNAREEWSLLHTEQTTLQKAIQAVKSFQNIMKQETSPLCMIDLRLIEMLDTQLVKKFSAIQLDSYRDYGGINGVVDENSPKNFHTRTSKDSSPKQRNQKILKNSSKNELNFNNKNMIELLSVVQENNQLEIAGNENEQSQSKIDDSKMSLRLQQNINFADKQDEECGNAIIPQKYNDHDDEDNIQQSILNVDNFHGFIYNNLQKVNNPSRRKSTYNVYLDNKNDKQIIQNRRKSAFNYVRDEKGGLEDQNKVKLVSQYLQQREIQKSLGLDQPPSPYVFPISSNILYIDKPLKLSDLHQSNTQPIRSQKQIPENNQNSQALKNQKCLTNNNNEEKKIPILKANSFYESSQSYKNKNQDLPNNFLQPIREQSEIQEILMPSFGNLIQNSVMSTNRKEQLASQSLLSPRVAIERSSVHGMNPSIIQNSEKHNQLLFQNSFTVNNNQKFQNNEQYFNSILKKDPEQINKNNMNKKLSDKQINLSIFNSQSKMLKTEQNLTQPQTINSLSSNSN